MKNKSIGVYIIASAIIWGSVSIGCAFVLRGTGLYNDISLIINGGAAVHLLFLWAPLANQLRKGQEEESETS